MFSGINDKGTITSGDLSNYYTQTTVNSIHRGQVKIFKEFNKQIYEHFKLFKLESRCMIFI